MRETDKRSFGSICPGGVKPEIGYDLTQNYPCWRTAAQFLKEGILREGFKVVGDIGGGAHPLLDPAFVRDNGISYHVFDLSREELDKAAPEYAKVQVDISAPLEQFSQRVAGRNFDLIFSHMLLEHILDPWNAHTNIFHALRPGGLAIHFYPSPHNLPLIVNRVMPESVSTALLKIAQPTRDLRGGEGKFKAYYKWCGNPSRVLHAKFEQIGFRVVKQTGYIGHTYYDRFKSIRAAELMLRPILLKLGLPITSFQLLILQRPFENS